MDADKQWWCKISGRFCWEFWSNKQVGLVVEYPGVCPGSSWYSDGRAVPGIDGPPLVSSYRTSSLGPGPQWSHLAIRAVEWFLVASWGIDTVCTPPSWALGYFYSVLSIFACEMLETGLSWVQVKEIIWQRKHSLRSLQYREGRRAQQGTGLWM